MSKVKDRKYSEEQLRLLDEQILAVISKWATNLIREGFKYEGLLEGILAIFITHIEHGLDELSHYECERARDVTSKLISILKQKQKQKRE